MIPSPMGESRARTEFIEVVREMKTIQAPRASTILYNFLTSQKNERPWLLPANICPIVPITFMKARVPLEFVDISARTLHMDLDRAQGRIKNRDFGGILYAHSYGEESTPEDFFALAKTHNPETLIVDDRCLCIPDFDVSSSADVVLFSTGYAKIVDLEYGGYAYIREEVDYHPVHLPFDPSSLAQLEQEYKSAVRDRTGFNYQDREWLATDLEMPHWAEYRKQIETGLKSSLRQRERLNAIYASRLPAEIQLPREYQNWRFNIRVMDQRRVLESIFSAGLFASSHYASLAGIMAEGIAPQAEVLAAEVVNLFNDHHFDEEKAEQVCDTVLDQLRGLS